MDMDLARALLFLAAVCVMLIAVLGTAAVVLLIRRG
jgi:hypothetical protein